MTFTKIMRTAALAGTLILALALNASQATSTQSKTTQSQSAPKTISAPTPREIADAKAKGLVWVNTSTKVYHKDGSFYGTTKHGKFMTEDEAQKAGFRAAKTPGGSKKMKSTAIS